MSYVGYFVLFISFCAILSLVSVGIYYYFNQHKLPQGVYQWLERYAPWSIRKRGLLNLHSEESVQREVDMRQEEAKEDAGGRSRQRVQRSEETHQEEVVGADGRKQVVTTTTTKIQYQRSEEY